MECLDAERDRTGAGWAELEIRVWRSVSVRFLRTLIHPWLGGRLLAASAVLVEERFPQCFGEKGSIR